MNHRAIDPDSERERQRLLAELANSGDPHRDDRYRPGSFGCHELMDRTSLLAGVLDGSVRLHPSCLHNPQWFALADQAVAALNELYQLIGDEHIACGAEEAGAS